MDQNAQNQNNKRQKKKKTIAAVMAAMCGICVIGLFFLNTTDMTFDFDFGSGSSDTEVVQYVYDGKGVHRISLYDPDWESDIFENREWLDQNRWLTYVEGGMAITLVDEDYDAYGDTIVMFADYFDALMHGDAERLNGFYEDRYFESHDRWEAITMQKIYNIRVEYLTSGDIEDAELGTVTRYYYKVTYMIMENDGTFRDDVQSDAEKAQFYELMDTGPKVWITNVTNSYIVQ
ncbi:MAG: hypothetical protein IJ493_09240 [Clostridia bacterium]|nr:hypothetical protein [Clostridia bacterium]